MLWSILAAVVGVIFIALGALCVLAAAMPNFGGSRDTNDGSIILTGVTLCVIGAGVIFFAGTLA